jgi:hypothetical protein
MIWICLIVLIAGLALGMWAGWYIHLHWGEGWARSDRWPYLVFLICLMGGLGGVINALLTDNGFIAPTPAIVDGKKIWRPGILGNIAVGVAAAFVSWGMYGPLSSRIIVRLNESTAKPAVDDSEVGLTLSGLVGAFLVGVGGARWLSNEVDKTLLRAAGSLAASSDKNPAAAKAILLASPADALEAAAK